MIHNIVIRQQKVTTRSLNEKSTHELNSQVLDFLCVSAGIRTLDPLIKSQLLYQLSYGDFFSLFEAAKIHFFYIFAKKIR